MVWLVAYQRVWYSNGLDGRISEGVVFLWFGWSDIRGCGILMVWVVVYQRLYSNGLGGRISEAVVF
jgi:hypothetical protein